MSISHFVDIKSLRRRPFGGLSVSNDIFISRKEGNRYDDTLYEYSYGDLVNTDISDILKISEIFNNVIIDRYFLTSNSGKSIALAKRIISGDGTYPTNLSYVYTIDALMTKAYKRRVFPYRASFSEAEMLSSLGDIFTPVVFLDEDRDSSRLITSIKAMSKDLAWLDTVTIQGWFPTKILYDLDYNPPPHAGWTIEGSHIGELAKITMRESRNTIYDLFSKSYRNMGGNFESSYDRFSKIASSWIGNSNLVDFKATLVPMEDTLTGKLILDIKDFVYYDPFRGDVRDVLSDLERDDYQCECAVVNNIADTLLEEASDFKIDFTRFSDITIYRQLNDLVYIVFNDKTDPNLSQYMSFDFCKRLFVHYGYVDLPIERIVS